MPGPLVTLAAAAPAIAPERVLDLLEGPATLWDAPSPGGRRTVFVAWGEAARAEAQGEGAVAEVAAEAARILDDIAPVTAWGDAPVEAPAPRLFGGVAFAPGAQAAVGKPIAPPWGGFADASFTLPACVYATDGERATLRANVPRGEAQAAARRLAEIAVAVARRGEAAPEAAPELPREHAELVAPDAFRALVRDALSRFAAGELEKVVLAAPSLLTAAGPIAIAPALARLREGYPACARFALPRGGATFVGATPERLLCVDGRVVQVDALAGSAPRRDGDDEAAARELLASEKDRREHALVVEAIVAALGPACEALEVPAAPAVRTLRNVHHLWTPIVGRLAAPSPALALAGRLHPTPAICGAPRAAALAWIRAREPAARGWYAGAVGWLGPGGSGDLWVGIRSALIEGPRAWLYAGVGLVAGSEPDAELAEVRLKRRPMLAALGAP